VSWEPSNEQANECYIYYTRQKERPMKSLLKHIHANPSLVGLDAPKLPTRSEIRAIPDVPDYTEEEVEELALAMWPGNTYYDYNQTGMDMARRVLAAGYRKSKP
jgi:hypothetical protein